MDPKRFDELTSLLAGQPSRRRVIAAAIGTLIAGLTGGGQALAASLRPLGAICRKPGDCASGICGPKDASGRRRCECPTSAPTACNGVCTDTSVDTSNCGTCGASCSGAAVCSGGACCVPREAGSNTCTASSQCCGTDVCISGQCYPCFPDGSVISAVEDCCTPPPYGNICGSCVPREAGSNTCTASSQCCGTDVCISGQCYPCFPAGSVISAVEDCCVPPPSGNTCL